MSAGLCYSLRLSENRAQKPGLVRGCCVSLSAEIKISIAGDLASLNGSSGIMPYDEEI